MIHTILFDMGGTLVDSKDFFQEFVSTFQKDVTQEFQEEFFKRLKGDSFATVAGHLTETMRCISQRYGWKDDSSQAKELYKNLFLHNSWLYDDVVGFLEDARLRGIHCYVVSDADADVLHEELKILGIHHFFEKFFISSEMQGYKPSKRVIDCVLPHLKDPLEGILFIGDSQVDVDAAKKLCVRSAQIFRKGKQPSNADMVIESLNEIEL